MPKARYGSHWAARTNPTSVAVACKSTTTMICTAGTVTGVPTFDTVDAVQNRPSPG